MKKFTLLELVIIIAILAVLMTILLPSLNKARSQAYQAVSKSNLSQIYKSFLKFSGQNNGRLPNAQPDNKEMFRNVLEIDFGGPESAKKTLLIPGQVYPSTAKQSYSPAQTLQGIAANNRNLTIEYGRRLARVHNPSTAYLMLEGRIIPGYNVSIYMIHFGKKRQDINSTSSQHTKYLFFHPNHKNGHLKADGATHSIHFKQLSSISQRIEWQGRE